MLSLISTKERDFGQLSVSYLVFILCSVTVSKACGSLVKVMCYAGTAWTHGSSVSLSLSLFLLQADSEVCGVEFALTCIQKSLPCIISEVW